jgi:hypothetical protein
MSCDLLRLQTAHARSFRHLVSCDESDDKSDFEVLALLLYINSYHTVAAVCLFIEYQ